MLEIAFIGKDRFDKIDDIKYYCFLKISTKFAKSW